MFSFAVKALARPGVVDMTREEQSVCLLTKQERKNERSGSQLKWYESCAPAIFLEQSDEKN